MTGQYTMSSTARASTAARFLKRAGGIIIAGVGLIALIIGITFIASQTWPTATGTVESCTTRVSHATSGARARQSCVVTWMDADQAHTASIDLGGTAHYPGESVDLRVHGDTAAVATPAWLGYAAAVIGLLLLAGGATFTLRKSRTASE